MHATPLSAALHLITACRADPGAITICAIGPLTNLALALEVDPGNRRSRSRIGRKWGGSMQAGGNVTPYAEANIWHDPHAADRVFGASWPVKIVGLDVTQEIFCTRDEFAALAGEVPRNLADFCTKPPASTLIFMNRRSDWRAVICMIPLRSSQR